MTTAIVYVRKASLVSNVKLKGRVVAKNIASTEQHVLHERCRMERRAVSATVPQPMQASRLMLAFAVRQNRHRSAPKCQITMVTPSVSMEALVKLIRKFILKNLFEVRLRPCGIKLTTLISRCSGTLDANACKASMAQYVSSVTP